MAECRAAEVKDIAQFSKYYSKEVEEKAKMVGIQLKGQTVANSEWRICQHFFGKAASQEQRKIVERHLRVSLTESSRSEGKQFIEKMVSAWKEGFDVYQPCKGLLM